MENKNLVSMSASDLNELKKMSESFEIIASRITASRYEKAIKASVDMKSIVSTFAKIYSERSNNKTESLIEGALETNNIV